VWRRDRPNQLWRHHSDAVYADLLERWLCGAPAHRLLKTDAFDEAATGALAPALARAEKLILMDVSPLILNSVRRYFPAVKAVVADARKTPFASASLNTVVSLSTLDHFRSRDELTQALAELRRVLAPAGFLVITLDNPRNPIVWLRQLLPFSWLRRLGIVPYYVGATLGARELADALVKLGFVVEDRAAIMHAPRVLAVALCRWVERWGSAASQHRLLRLLFRAERLAGWPTRYASGHFVAVLARVPGRTPVGPEPILSHFRRTR